MDWATAQLEFLKRHGGALTTKEHEVMTSYPWNNLSIPGLWSWRGAIWAKYEGAYPAPESVGLEEGHVFFDKDFVCHSKTIGSDGQVKDEEWFHHGRRLKPTHRLWANRRAAYLSE